MRRVHRPDALGDNQLLDDGCFKRPVRIHVRQYILLHAHHPGPVGQFGWFHRCVRVVSAGAGHRQSHRTSAGRIHVRHDRTVGHFILRRRILHIFVRGICLGRWHTGHRRREGKRRTQFHAVGVGLLKNCSVKTKRFLNHAKLSRVSNELWFGEP